MLIHRLVYLSTLLLSDDALRLMLTNHDSHNMDASEKTTADESSDFRVHIGSFTKASYTTQGLLERVRSTEL